MLIELFVEREGTMQTKLSKLKGFMAAGDHRSALKLAAAFPQLGTHKADIQRGWAAMSNPRFYREIGESPDKLISQGLGAIRKRYGWREESIA